MKRHEVLIIETDSESDLGAAASRILKKSYQVEFLTLRSNDQLSTIVHGQSAIAQGQPDAWVICVPWISTGTEDDISSVLRSGIESPVLLIGSADEPEILNRLLRCGVADFISPPLSEAELMPRLWRQIGRHKASRFKPLLLERLGLKQLIGGSPAFQAALDRVPVIAKSNGTVLLEGETGTGKEVFARAIHYLSPRAGKPFVPVNCGAVPLELIENELFGHEQGAFTGASCRSHGLVREAEGGTLFLDEVDSLPPMAQVKLLRLLQEREFRPLGSPKTRTADIRMIGATNCEIDEVVKTNRLRKDFYYRLNVLPLRLPALRERKADILLLARHFLTKFARQQKKPIPGFSAQVEETLLLHDWPGNIRELEHVMERAFVLAEDRMVIRPSDILIPEAAPTEQQSFRQAKSQAVSDFERSYIESLLIANRGNITRAAMSAQKNRRAFWELIRKHRIDAEQFRTDSV